MAKQRILWTALPYGRSPSEGAGEGRWRVSIMVSPRLTPEADDEQTLASFPEWLDWPATLAGATFSARIGGDTTKLVALNEADSELWQELLHDATPVAGFVFKDMSAVNLRSYSVRNVLGFMRRNYGRLAATSGFDPPRLLPWRDADPSLKQMLGDIGTRTYKLDLADRSMELPLPGFDRFFGQDVDRAIDERVFSDDAVYDMIVPPVGAAQYGIRFSPETALRRAMEPDWYNPRPGGPGTPLLGNADAAVMDQFHSADEYTFYQADRFYRRQRPTEEQLKVRRPDFANVPPPVTAPEYDFHRIVASFADYPQLLRRLGLVLDFALESDGVLDSRIAAAGGVTYETLQIEIDWSNGHRAADDVRPLTACYVDKERFVPLSRTGDQKRGLLDLGGANDRWTDDKKTSFDVYQVDPDGAALKTVDFTLTAQRLLARSLDVTQRFGKVTYTTGDKQGVAALRSGGIGVSHHGRARALAQDAAAGSLKNAAIESGTGDSIIFFAEDLHRGYRIDVATLPKGQLEGPWRSLCARDGEYALVNGQPVQLPGDEGYVSEGSVTSSIGGNANPDDHYLHESLFRWTGWSLCAPRPGPAIKAEEEDGTHLQREVPSTVDDVAEHGSGFVAKFRVAKGSLPRLRFGQMYRVRARVVDVAGNSLDLDDPSLGATECATDAVGYWRLEPVDPPALSQRKKTTEGEQLERMVIRSNYDLKAKDYVATLPAAADFTYWATDERHFVPPKSSQQQCETHGLFDAFMGDWKKIKEGYAIAAREEKTLFDGGTLITPSTVAEVATTELIPPQLPDASNPVGDRLAGGQYVIHPKAKLKTAWLPDGAAGGVALRSLGGLGIPGLEAGDDLGGSCVVATIPNGDLVLLVPHAGQWPDLQGFRLILAEREESASSPPCAVEFADSGKPKWDEDERTLTLFVPKGHIVRLSYSSFVSPKYLGTFGIPRWTQAGAEFWAVIWGAYLGANWLITPSRDLTLVHATQQPVCEPSLRYLSVQRRLGDHDAHLSCRQVNLHGPSTGKFEIEADWDEWVDDPTKSEPSRQHFAGQLGEIPLSENHSDTFILDQAVEEAAVASPDGHKVTRARGNIHAFGDTRFRLVRYRARATTRYREYLPAAIYADRENVTRLGPAAEGPSMLLPPDDDLGAPVLPGPGGSIQQSVVLASAPPADPKLMYIVPTVAWDRSIEGRTWDSVRHGDGLRVWLDRPWFSSGDGEMLGVVLYGAGANFQDVPEGYREFVTQWGGDPIWDSTPPKMRARAEDFPLRVMNAQHVLQEKPDGDLVTVVAHRVQWSAERKLWFADIAISPGTAYMPMVRLALVRYQPNALDGANLSKVVLADFAALLPRRRVRLERDGDRLRVAVHGPSPNFGSMKFPNESEYLNISYLHGLHETGRNRMELVLQTRDPQINSDLAWEDQAILVSEVVGGSFASGIGYDPVGVFQPAIKALRGPSRRPGSARGPTERAGAALDPQSAVIERIDVSEIIGERHIPQFDPPFWQASVTLGPMGRGPRRLMLREFERFYTDHGITDVRKRGHMRRVIEERLVYAETFDI